MTEGPHHPQDPHATEDVLETVAQLIEEHFGRPLPELQHTVSRVPGTNPRAVQAVHGFHLLAGAQGVLERAENHLLEILGTEPGVLDEQQMQAAQQVNDAVAARDARVLAVLHLLHPPAAPAWSSTPGRHAAMTSGLPPHPPGAVRAQAARRSAR
ncbi:WecB/TagA/CpsF family glycosyltransferase [Streptomyces sp. YIM 98790]|uniref:WecB/TagA/CpsF family glycosyltransferase n=1 Tax=Streptomyces sp. YIM 98790 TaxID=2689077 RepID=UPI00140E577C|nr:WecB/TagA/CpsF family glycosyltransferase [Streptomyces sp. YIM 98790]